MIGLVMVLVWIAATFVGCVVVGWRRETVSPFTRDFWV